MKQRLNGAQLKWIAIITMLIDHIGASLVLNHIEFLGFNSMTDTREPIVLLYLAMRLIGRFAFPIFLFLLIEGFEHTSNRHRYLLNMLIFAIIAEIPFDLFVSQSLVDWSYQSIFVTLSLGLIMLMVLERIEVSVIYRWLIILGFGLINEYLLMGDFGLYGLILLGGMYELRKNIPMRNVFILIVGLYQITQGFSVFFINQYNGVRGKQWKYFFYLFYPAHLLILYALSK